MRRTAPTLGLTPAQLERTEAREAAMREARAPVASRSVVPVRCGACGEWNAAEHWVCRVCGIPRTAHPTK